jgi:hypothetical protein
MSKSRKIRVGERRGNGGDEIGEMREEKKGRGKALQNYAQIGQKRQIKEAKR